MGVCLSVCKICSSHSFTWPVCQWNGQMALLLYSALVVPILSLLFYNFYYNPSIPVDGKIIVQTDSGGVQGSLGISRDGRQFYQWLKIPFAQPPLGNLRFASPKFVKKWTGILDATRQGPKCAQLTRMGYEGDEDCLHLNIYVPKLHNLETRQLPVIVWLHGGAFTIGSASEYGPQYFMDEEVILIIINYRLNLFGFLSTGDKEIRGNMGLKDQLMALQWIQKNVAHFHGDPTKVTVGGVSAGAISAHYLVLSEKSRGLFQKAISMSGVAVAPWAFRSVEDASRQTKKFAKILNCPTQNSKDLTACLRKLGRNQILSAYQWDMDNLYIFDPTRTGDMIVPVVEAVDDDESFLVDTPYNIVTQGRAQRVPWLAGMVAQEGLLTSLSFMRDEEILRKMEKNWPTSFEIGLTLLNLREEEKLNIVSQVREYYFSKNGQGMTDPEKFRNYTQFFTDAFFQNYISQAVEIQRQFSPVYLYYFNKTGGPSLAGFFGGLGTKYHIYVELALFLLRNAVDKYILNKPPKIYGICHGDDVPMMMPFAKLFGVPKDVKSDVYWFSKNFVKMLTEFATDENSLKFTNVPFPPTPTEGTLKYMRLDDSPQMMDEPWEDSMKFWRSLNILKKYTQTFVKYGKDGQFIF